MKNYLITLLVSLACHSISNAQTQPGQPPKVIQPSPTVSAMQRYGDIPVSLYTGVPDISIPLYVIKSGSIQVPVSLSYHASGIKVADEASRVGLGWVLNAGGVIGRTVYGEDDFFSIGKNYHNGNTSMPNILSAPVTGFYSEQLIQEVVNEGGLPNDHVDVPFNGYVDASYFREHYDFQPDQYSYNFPGGAGKFILKRDKTAVLGNLQKLSITCMDNDANSWEVKTPDGTTYLFAQVENYKTPGDGRHIKSAWYLTKITSQTGDEINFSYTTIINNYIKSVGGYFESRDDKQIVSGKYVTAFPEICKIITYNNSIQGKEYTSVFLDKITFKTGEVKFIYADDREDVLNDKRLTKVQVFRKDAKSFALSLFKEFELSQAYFNGTSDRDFSVGYVQQEGKRLKLTAVTEKDAAGNALPPYQFAYNNETDGPAKTSFARDHWGYYNGKMMNESLIPSFTFNYTGNYATSFMGLTGDNRNPSPLYANLFSLKEIRYPTGGKTVFDYESNDFNVVKSQQNTNYYDLLYPETREVTLSNINYDGNITGLNPADYTNPGAKLFDLRDMYLDNTFGATSTGLVTITAMFRLKDYVSPGDLNIYQNNKITFSMRSVDGEASTGPENLLNNVTLTEGPASNTTYYYPVSSNPNQQYSFIMVKRQYMLPAKQYTWQLYLDPIVTGNNIMADVILSIKYNALTSKEPDNITVLDNGTTIYGTDYAGGIRIKRITSYAHDNDTRPAIKRYMYRAQDGESSVLRSTGRRMSRPIYSYYERSKAEYSDIEGQTNTDYFQHLMRESDSNLPINSSNGTIVGYDKVIVLQGENGENGKTEYEFENISDRVFEYVEFDQLLTQAGMLGRKPPASCLTSNPGNGNLKRQIDYKLDNTTYKKVSEIINEYTDYYVGMPLSLGIEKRDLPGYYLFGGFPTEMPSSVYIYPAMQASRNILRSSEIKTYDANDESKFISQKTTYDYDQGTHLQLTRTTTTLNNGDESYTDYKYPADFTGTATTAVLTDMAGAKFMHALPVSVSKSLYKSSSSTTKLTSAVIHTYKTDNLHVVPDEVYILETAKPVDGASLSAYVPSSASYPQGYNQKLKFERYDASGNILQVRKTGDIPASYIWDYQHTQPIAEVTNAIYDDIAYTSFEADGTGNWNNYTGTINTGTPADIPPTGSKYYSLAAGAELSKTVTSGAGYIISYWRKSISPFTISGGSGTVQTGQTINGWTYHEHKVTASSTTLSISGSGAIDEVRIYPANAMMKTYTYDPLLGMTNQADVNNTISTFEYDGFGRVKLIRDKDRNIIKTFDYQFQQ